MRYAYVHTDARCQLCEMFLLAGHAGFSELWRDGEKVADLVRTSDYDYVRPEIYR